MHGGPELTYTTRCASTVNHCLLTNTRTHAHTLAFGFVFFHRLAEKNRPSLNIRACYFLCLEPKMGPEMFHSQMLPQWHTDGTESPLVSAHKASCVSEFLLYAFCNAFNDKATSRPLCTNHMRENKMFFLQLYQSQQNDTKQ